MNIYCDLFNSNIDHSRVQHQYLGSEKKGKKVLVFSSFFSFRNSSSFMAKFQV